MIQLKCDARFGRGRGLESTPLAVNGDGGVRSVKAHVRISTPRAWWKWAGEKSRVSRCSVERIVSRFAGAFTQAHQSSAEPTQLQRNGE